MHESHLIWRCDAIGDDIHKINKHRKNRDTHTRQRHHYKKDNVTKGSILLSY